jgi:N-methylhydantoinase A
MPRYRVGVDVGGTFTDLVVLDLEAGELRTEKTLTTPRDLWEGIWAGLEQAGVPLDDVEIAHGTTVGLNTFLERRGVPTGLITTHGFRDAYEIGTGARTEMYNLFFRKPVPLVPREHRLEVRERLDAAGEVVTPMEEDDVVAAAEHFRRHEIRDIAVCFLHSYRNPAHEERAAAILAEVYPEALVSVSHALVRQWREYDRTSTTAINAYIRRRTGAYVERATEALRDAGYERDFFVNQSSGGVVSATTAMAKPVATLMSGPAGGVAASAEVGGAAGLRDVISFDMGGTSTDVAVVSDGRPRLTADTQVDEHPIAVPSIAIHSIGAGGGSLAWLDDVGALNVGPRSAGAEPGPVCYGRGGTEPTVTDANLVLGRVAPAEFVPGGLVLDREAAIEAIEREVGGPLGLGPIEAAAGIVEIVNLKMAMAVRAVTVQRGLDPKDFALCAFGGAGAAHACWIARELGIPRIVVPTASGQFSALGIALTDVRHDFVRTVLTSQDEVTPEFLTRLFGAIEADARDALEREGVAPGQAAMARSIDARYEGQEYTISVPLPDGDIDAAAIERMRERFHKLHEQTYSHSSAGEPVELVNARVAATGHIAEVDPPMIEDGGEEPPAAARADVVETHFDSAGEAVECPVWRRSDLLAGNRVDGPAIVADVGATIVLPPGATARVDGHANLVVDLAA